MTTNTTPCRRRDDRRTTSRLHPTPPARPGRARHRHHRRRGTQRHRHRSPRRGRPHFLYRHRDLLERIHAAETQPPDKPEDAAPRSPAPHCKPTCSPPSNAAPAWPHAPNNSRTAYPNCSANKPGAQPDSAHPPTSTNFNNASSTLEQQAVDLRLQLEERDQDLAAARAANRELMAQTQRIPADRMTHPPKRLHNTCCAHTVQQSAAGPAQTPETYSSFGPDPKRTAPTAASTAKHPTNDYAKKPRPGRNR